MSKQSSPDKGVLATYSFNLDLAFIVGISFYLKDMADLSTLFRIISGESVFGVDIDSRIREASNRLSARAVVEIFNRCDTSFPGWEKNFANVLLEIAGEEPNVLIGFRGQGEARAADFDEEEKSHFSEDETISYYLKLRFTNADAAYYQFHLFPTMDYPGMVGMGRKRENEIQHLRIDFRYTDDFQSFVEYLRSNPHLVAIEDSTEELFARARSHRI